MAKTGTIAAGEKILEVLNLLLRHFAHGLTPGEVARSTGISASNITRYINTLEAQGFAERIQETGNIRPSHRLAQHAVAIMQSLSNQEARAKESINRITKEI